MSESHKFVRRVQNGKVVYAPQSPPTRRPVRRVASPPLISLHFGSWMATGLLLSVGTAVAGLLWLSWQAIANPDVAFWLNQFLPAATTPTARIDQPRTLKQIQRHLKTANQLPGTPVILAADFSVRSRLKAATDLLIPVLQSSCRRDCPKLSELHIYRSLQLPYPLRLFQGERHYHLLDRVTVEGPTEAALIKQVRHSNLVTRTHPLPLTHLQQYEPAPKPGIWLRLSGLRSRGSATSAYGQVFYFHPEQSYLGLMLNWASPRGGFPVWKQVIEGDEPELFIDQSVGLEPQFSVYQLQRASRGRTRLRPILLNQPAFEHPVYTQGLMLARRGLWKPAQNLLLTVKKKQPQRWSEQAQAQLTLIDLHAKVTAKRATQSASSPVQKILARIINGSWSAATAVFEHQDTRSDDVRAMLEADSGRLMERVEATLKVYPKQQDAIAWGAMLMHVQRGPSTAFDWTRQKTAGDLKMLKKVQTLLQRLEAPPKPISPFDSPRRQQRPPIAPPQKRQPAAPTPPPVSETPLELEIAPLEPEITENKSTGSVENSAPAQDPAPAVEPQSDENPDLNL